MSPIPININKGPMKIIPLLNRPKKANHQDLLYLLPFGYLSLAIWPLRKVIKSWIEKNPDTHIRFCIGQIVRSQRYPVEVNSCIQRIKILGYGKSSIKPPIDEQDLINWWQGKINP